MQNFPRTHEREAQQSRQMTINTRLLQTELFGPRKQARICRPGPGLDATESQTTPPSTADAHDMNEWTAERAAT